MADKETAKTAEIARFLPKWQALQILCQMTCQYGKKFGTAFALANLVPQKKYFSA